MVQQIFDNQKQWSRNSGKVPLKMFNVATLLCEWLHDNGKEIPISKSNALIKELHNWHAKMKSDSHALKGKEELEWIKHNPDKPLSDMSKEITDYKYFFAYSSYPNAYPNRKNLKEDLVKWLSETSLPIQNKITEAVA